MADKAESSLVGADYREKYGKDGHNGDQFAVALKTATETSVKGKKAKFDRPKLEDIAKANNIDIVKYAKLNNGQFRMNVGNRLRGLFNKGIAVKVGKDTFHDPSLAKAPKWAEEKKAA